MGTVSWTEIQQCRYRLTFLSNTIEQEELILDPSSFEIGAAGPTWIDIEGCVWHGPTNLLDQTPLASVSQYRSNPKLVHFFTRVLGIKDANWNDYLAILSKLRVDPSPSDGLPNKIWRLYELLSNAAIGEEGWTEIRKVKGSARLLKI